LLSGAEWNKLDASNGLYGGVPKGYTDYQH